MLALRALMLLAPKPHIELLLLVLLLLVLLVLVLVLLVLVLLLVLVVVLLLLLLVLLVLVLLLLLLLLMLLVLVLLVLVLVLVLLLLLLLLSLTRSTGVGAAGDLLRAAAALVSALRPGLRGGSILGRALVGGKYCAARVRRAAGLPARGGHGGAGALRIFRRQQRPGLGAQQDFCPLPPHAQPHGRCPVGGRAGDGSGSARAGARGCVSHATHR